MKWQIVNIVALFSIPVVPSLSVYFGYLSDKDNRSAAGLLAALFAISFCTRVMADREAGGHVYLWLLGTAAAVFFFGYFYLTDEFPSNSKP